MKNIKYLLFMLLFIPVTVLGFEKEETVFSNLDYTGKVKNIKVTNHLEIDETSTINDNSTLEDILNISGDEKFNIKDGILKWETKGQDIVYKGKTTNMLPITTKITYYLDGKEQKLSKIIGKKGHVDIKLEFKNESSSIVNINGNVSKIYTPFVTTVGAILDSNAKNIEVTNGKVVNNGNQNVILAISTPGLYESTGIQELKDMNSVTISYDTTNFKLNNIYIVSTPKILEDIDLDIFDKLDNLVGGIVELKDGMDQLVSGSNELKSKLGSSLIFLDNTNEALTSEDIEKISNQAVAQIDSQSEAIANTAWLQTKKSLENSNNTTILEYATDAGQNILLAYFGSTDKMQVAIACANEYQTSGQIAFQQGTYCPMFLANGGTINDLNMISVVDTQLGTLSNNTTYYVAENVSKQVSLLTSKQTADTLSRTLVPTVANEVKNTIFTQIKQSITQLYNGISKLDEGINKFSNEGIDTLYNYSNKINNYKSTFEALKQLSDDYQGFTSNNSSKVIFISKVESVEK